MSKSEDQKYRLNKAGEFTIKDYNSTKAFSSFFPGVAGTKGIPMWTFYVNRAQCICSMGIDGKHHPIMEFLPANWAYNLVSSQGFRTFIKLPQSKIKFYEPFQNYLRDQEMQKEQSMKITSSQLILEEINHTLGLKFSVKYFNVPEAKYAGLVRILNIENLNQEAIAFEGLDGLPLIIPYGLDNSGLKNIRRLVEAFVEVVNYENKIPFFKGKVKPADRPDVVRIKKGNFYLGFEETEKETKLVTPIVDPVKIFDIRADYNYPANFLKSSPSQMLQGQIFENRLPAAMGLFSGSIAAGKSFTYVSIIGQANTVEELKALVSLTKDKNYIAEKAETNEQIIKQLTQNNFINSQNNALNSYARQNFLDNTLRGGFPYTLKGKKSASTLHLFSRKHGDLERDYNDYRLTPTPFSQGNGNFRDVNQNRRLDLFFNPDLKQNNVEHFYNLIQLDGFNPLVIKEILFSIKDAAAIKNILAEYLPSENREDAFNYLQETFSPGKFALYLQENKITITADLDSFLGDLLAECEKIHATGYGESYWTDHWTYNLDLLENYLAVYPENKLQILFKEKTFSFYDNPHCVQPRADKYVIWEDKPMQLNSVVLDEEKKLLINQRRQNANKVRTGYGKKEIYFTSLINKMLSLVINKLASLDAAGVGVEMESDKPNWYDALNGLPGLMGSSINETLELKRAMLFILDALAELAENERTWLVYEELLEFMAELNKLLKQDLSAFDFWDQATSSKEKYRAKTRLGISGIEHEITAEQLEKFLKAGLQKLEIGIEKAWDNQKNVIASYFINHVTDYEKIMISHPEQGECIKRNSRGLACFRVKSFQQQPLPLFLEGPVHYLRSNQDHEKSRSLIKNIKSSGLFDQKLKMYKVNESLQDQVPEIGRARTFSPGWYENESIWLHMEYKYILEILKSGFYQEFYENFQNVVIPFLDPNVYGRSILENSSFIVSSANPDPALHGNGFVARLSGATAEFINILFYMMLGKQPFELAQNGDLIFQLKPALAAWLFTKTVTKSRLFFDDKWQELEFPKNSFSFILFGKILVTYHNYKMRNTFGENAVSPHKWTLSESSGQKLSYEGTTLPAELAHKIRDRKIKRIEVELS
ncbi:MAG: hypothetical protein R6U84_00470 [Candidatus Cloacimonadales bacterium]